MITFSTNSIDFSSDEHLEFLEQGISKITEETLTGDVTKIKRTYEFIFPRNDQEIIIDEDGINLRKPLLSLYFCTDEQVQELLSIKD